jgi:putative peptide zinc metalloprotease protein
MWIGGASALLFNGNPLLKFDGYYVLSDAIEIPNLGTRSNQYIASLVLRHLLRVEKVRDPVTGPGEAAWFLGYGLASFAYRLVILFVIALFVSEKFFGLGVGLAIFAIGMQIVRPMVRHLAFLFTSARLEAHRARSIATSSALVLLLALLTLAVPVSLLTTAEGVVWLPEDAQVRARAGGFVERFLVEPGSRVEAGDALVVTRDETLDAEVAALEAKLRELRARHHAERRSDLVRAQITADEISSVAAELSMARERAREGIIRSPANGRFVAPRARDLVGRFVQQGERVGYVMGPSVSTVRVVVPQSDVALVRERTRAVELRLRSRVERVLSGEIRREVPAATDRLPSRALGSDGGGLVPVDPTDEDGLRTLESVFQFDVSLARQIAPREIGARVYVRFDHGSEPVAARAYRAVKRVFLRRIGV